MDRTSRGAHGSTRLDPCRTLRSAISWRATSILTSHASQTTWHEGGPKTDATETRTITAQTICVARTKLPPSAPFAWHWSPNLRANGYRVSGAPAKMLDMAYEAVENVWLRR